MPVKSKAAVADVTVLLLERLAQSDDEGVAEWAETMLRHGEGPPPTGLPRRRGRAAPRCVGRGRHGERRPRP
jgi:hypothetical protein